MALLPDRFWLSFRDKAAAPRTPTKPRDIGPSGAPAAVGA
jgi:hypothetical protein